MLKGKRIIAAELKSDRGSTTPEQDAWLEAFRAVGAEVYTWRPADWPAVVETLRREGTRAVTAV